MRGPVVVSGDDYDVRRLQALGALLDLELNPLVLLQRAEASGVDRGEVREHIRGPVLGGDEAEALLSVEPLDHTSSHNQYLLLLLRTTGPLRGSGCS